MSGVKYRRPASSVAFLIFSVENSNYAKKKGGIINRLFVYFSSGAGHAPAIYTMLSKLNTNACTKPENRSK